jgi:hypothetical protein
LHFKVEWARKKTFDRLQSWFGISCVLVNPGWVGTAMGGPKAPLLPQESVTAMRQLIDTFGPKHSGNFFNYDGRKYPW